MDVTWGGAWGPRRGALPARPPGEGRRRGEPSPGLGPAGRPWGSPAWREATLSDAGRCLPEAQDGKGPVGGSAHAPHHPDDPPAALPEADAPPLIQAGPALSSSTSWAPAKPPARPPSPGPSGGSSRAEGRRGRLPSWTFSLDTAPACATCSPSFGGRGNPLCPLPGAPPSLGAHRGWHQVPSKVAHTGGQPGRASSLLPLAALSTAPQACPLQTHARRGRRERPSQS